MTIQGQAAVLRKKTNIIYPTINLDAGTPQKISLSDLAPYFNAEHLDFQGINHAQYLQTGKLT